MTQPTINDLTIKKVDREMEETVWLDDKCIGSLLYDWRTTNITAEPAKGRPRVFFYKNMDQAKQHIIDHHVKNKDD